MRMMCNFSLIKIIGLCLTLVVAVLGENPILDGGANDTPDVLSYNSPLRRPDSLKSPQYFDFLNTLYRHDSSKDKLFSSVRQGDASGGRRSRRALTFQPLFVYRQLHHHRPEPTHLFS